MKTGYWFAWLSGAFTFAVVESSQDVRAQFTTTRSYSDMYRESYQRSRTPALSPRNYTIDKYYYHNQNISPYLNLVRPTNQYTPRYQSLVQPELQRRQNFNQSVSRSAPAPTFSTVPNYGGPSRQRSAYQSKVYGGFRGGP